jgi:hypothetical protein
MVLIDSREHAKRGIRIVEGRRTTLSAPAQLAVLFQIQRMEDEVRWDLQEWTDVTGYSRSTLKRVCDELTSLALCQAIAEGRHVFLSFENDRADLWRAALPYLDSPVRSRTRAKVQDQSIGLKEAGITALAEYTMIAAGRDKVYAMASAAFTAACKEGRVEEIPFASEEGILVECWKYAPRLLAQEGVGVVDRLSLYLSLVEERDERMQAALAELLEGMKW